MDLKHIVFNTYKVSQEAYETALRYIEPFTCKKGEMIMRQGEVCKYVFIINEGVFRNFAINDEGYDHTRWFAEDGDLFTSMLSFSCNEKAIASVEALCDSHGWKITIENAWRLLDEYKEWAVWANHLFADGLAVMEKRYSFLGTGNAYARFCNLYKWRRSDVLRHIPLQHIASYLGVTPQSISRFRRKLVKSNSD